MQGISTNGMPPFSVSINGMPPFSVSINGMPAKVGTPFF